jgi:hypothetical protein
MNRRRLLGQANAVALAIDHPERDEPAPEFISTPVKRLAVVVQGGVVARRRVQDQDVVAATIADIDEGSIRRLPPEPRRSTPELPLRPALDHLRCRLRKTPQARVRHDHVAAGGRARSPRPSSPLVPPVHPRKYAALPPEAPRSDRRSERRNDDVACAALPPNYDGRLRVAFAGAPAGSPRKPRRASGASPRCLRRSV